MHQFQFSGGYVSFPRWSQTNQASLGKSLEAPRPQGCDAGS